jgi:hypothetical protein
MMLPFAASTTSLTAAGVVTASMALSEQESVMPKAFDRRLHSELHDWPGAEAMNHLLATV